MSVTPNTQVAGTRATQGHRYAYTDWSDQVLALESGELVRVARINPDGLWLGEVRQVSARWLTPMPMRYFHGEVPRG